jgi:hypothetical protein
VVAVVVMRGGCARDGDDDGGQVLPLVALVMVFAGFLAYGVARLGAEAVAVARARTAADAAALAAAGVGPGGDAYADADAAAEAAAVANGAQLVSVEWLGTDVRVRVRAAAGVVGGGRVEAVAVARPGRVAGDGPG